MRPHLNIYLNACCPEELARLAAWLSEISLLAALADEYDPVDRGLTKCLIKNHSDAVNECSTLM